MNKTMGHGNLDMTTPRLPVTALSALPGATNAAGALSRTDEKLLGASNGRVIAPVSAPIEAIA